MSPTYFATPAEFRKWLRKYHASASELWVGFHKKASGKPSLTWPESVDEALCFGWIDGIRKSVDATSYTIRFTPRRKGSIWSTVNTKRAQELIGEGRLQPAGLRAFEVRDPVKSGVYSFEQRKAIEFSAELLAKFRANRKAWTSWQSCPPWYRRTSSHWVSSAKKEETRERRFATLLDDCEAGRNIKQLQRTEKKK